MECSKISRHNILLTETQINCLRAGNKLIASSLIIIKVLIDLSEIGIFPPEFQR